LIKDLPITEDGRAAQELVETFVREKVLTESTDSDRDGGYPIGLLADFDKLGVFGPSGESPEADVQLSLVETVAGGDPGLAYHFAGEVAARHIVERSGHAAPEGARFDLAYYEGFGRSPLEIGTVATATADGYSISGLKRGVVMRGDSGSLVVVATLDGAPAAFVLDHEAIARLTIVRDDHAVGKLGLRSAPTADIALDDLHLSEGARLVVDPAAVLGALAWYRLAVSSIALGIGQAAVRYAIGYAQERVTFGRTIIDNQGVEFPLVEADMAIDAARLQILETWDRVRVAPGTEANVGLVSHVYGVACGAGCGAAVVSVNTLGGHGYLMDHPVERWYRDVTALSTLDFDPLVHTSAIF
jgi:alkylation response protein AidB-like acyl-CoA dehydrogenase